MIANTKMNSFSFFPEESISYHEYDIHKEYNLQQVPYTIEENQKTVKCAPTFMLAGFLQQTKGSCYMEFGNTKVVAAILPPRENTQQTLKPIVGVPVYEIKYAKFATKRNDSEEKLRTLEIAFKKAIEPSICLDKYINVKIEIGLYVLEDDGCALGTSINCCSISLAEGGIALYGMLTAATVFSLNNEIYFNPTAIQEHFVKNLMSKNDDAINFGLACVVNVPSFNQVTENYHTGISSFENIRDMILSGLKLNNIHLELMKGYLLKTIRNASDKAL